MQSRPKGQRSSSWALRGFIVQRPLESAMTLPFRQRRIFYSSASLRFFLQVPSLLRERFFPRVGPVFTTGPPVSLGGFFADLPVFFATAFAALPTAQVPRPVDNLNSEKAMEGPRFDKLADHAEQEKIKITEPMISWFFIIALLKNVVSLCQY
jgi:hypothetical protein